MRTFSFAFFREEMKLSLLAFYYLFSICLLRNEFFGVFSLLFYCIVIIIILLLSHYYFIILLYCIIILFYIMTIIIISHIS